MIPAEFCEFMLDETGRCDRVTHETDAKELVKNHLPLPECI